ncbi:MAG: 2-keto-4-pentenoate hydratase [Gammaproteobacteria bacterium]
MAPLSALASRLAAAWRSRGVIDGVRPEEVPLSREEAYAVQDRMVEAIGEPVTGWKVGATSAKMRELDGHDDVIPGRLLAPTTFCGSSQQLDIAQFPRARLEAEFAFRINADLSPRAAPHDPGEIGQIVTLHPAMEIIADRYPRGAGHPDIGTLLTIADNGGGIGFVAGDPVFEYSNVDFHQHHVALTVNGGPESDNFLGEMRCSPLQVLTDLVNALGVRGIGLEAGQFVTTGAAAVPVHVEPGCRIRADFGGLGDIEVVFSSP